MGRAGLLWGLARGAFPAPEGSYSQHLYSEWKERELFRAVDEQLAGEKAKMRGYPPFCRGFLRPIGGQSILAGAPNIGKRPFGHGGAALGGCGHIIEARHSSIYLRR